MAGGDPFAFPFPDTRDENGCGIMEGSTGMTLRDWFAGQALVGLMQRRITKNEALGLDGEAYAMLSYRIADAMLAERAKGPAA